MNTKTVNKILVVPFLLHASFLLLVGSVAFYSFAFTGDTIWLAFDWGDSPGDILVLFIKITIGTALPAIPFLVGWLDS